MTGLIPYINDIPDGPNNPSFDQPNMKANTNAISQYVTVDHQPFGANNSGYHKTIHQLPIGPVGTADPAAIVGIGQLYTKLITDGITTDTQLFYRTGLGGISRLTGDSALETGYQWLGGVLIQWGKTTVSVTSGTVTGSVNFPISFPTACFIVQPTLFVKIPPILLSVQQFGTISIAENLNQNNFTYFIFTNSPSLTVPPFGGFYWIAIGN